MGKWRGPRTPGDPALSSAQWRKDRAYWIALRLPCARCHRPIDYDGPRYLITNGKRRLNPRSLVVGHIVSRYEARQRGWTEQRTHARANQQPECLDCSNRSGARLGQRVQATRLPSTTPNPNPTVTHTRRW